MGVTEPAVGVNKGCGRSAKDGCGICGREAHNGSVESHVFGKLVGGVCMGGLVGGIVRLFTWLRAGPAWWAWERAGEGGTERKSVPRGRRDNNEMEQERTVTDACDFRRCKVLHKATRQGNRRFGWRRLLFGESQVWVTRPLQFITR